SRLLNSAEQNYSTIEREALAIFWCLHKLEHYLSDRPVIIEIDHRPLQNFHKNYKLNNKRINTWLIKYQDLLPNIQLIKYKKGKTNGDADTMSRPDLAHILATLMIPNLSLSPPQLNVTTRSMTKATASTPTATCPTLPVAIPHPTSSLPPDFSIDRIKRTQHSDPTLYETIQQILVLLRLILY
ncbi:unnamed protein product, partial [Didymodactylos carnosus]